LAAIHALKLDQIVRSSGVDAGLFPPVGAWKRLTQHRSALPLETQAFEDYLPWQRPADLAP
jgi:hypothetical protein